VLFQRTIAGGGVHHGRPERIDQEGGGVVGSVETGEGGAAVAADPGGAGDEVEAVDIAGDGDRRGDEEGGGRCPGEPIGRRADRGPGAPAASGVDGLRHGPVDTVGQAHHQRAGDSWIGGEAEDVDLRGVDEREPGIAGDEAGAAVGADEEALAVGGGEEDRR